MGRNFKDEVMRKSLVHSKNIIEEQKYQIIRTKKPIDFSKALLGSECRQKPTANGKKRLNLVSPNLQV